MSRSRCLMLALALVLFGCNGQKGAPTPPPESDPAPAPAPKDDPAPPAAEKAPPKPAVPPVVTWTQDVQQMRAPEAPVSGQFRGHPFAPKTCELNRLLGRFLTLRQDGEGEPEMEVKILLSSMKEEDFSGKTYEVKPDDPLPGPVVHVSWKSGARRLAPESQQFAARYALRLEFGQERDGKLPGKLYLCLPDESQSCIAGTFSAEVEPDYAKPPRPDELPCVLGRIAIKGHDGLNVLTGFLGLTAEGKPVSNLVGWNVSSGVGSASSVIDPPQRSTLVHDAAAGCVCRHSRMSPGRYLFYTCAGDRYLDWRWVEVRDKAPLTLDFTLEPDVTGAVEVVLPKDAKEGARLIPLDEAGQLPVTNKEALDMLSLAMKTDVDAKDGRVLLDGLRPGRYRVAVGAAAKDVTVKAKETAKADLSAP